MNKLKVVNILPNWSFIHTFAMPLRGATDMGAVSRNVLTICRIVFLWRN